MICFAIPRAPLLLWPVPILKSLHWPHAVFWSPGLTVASSSVAFSPRLLPQQAGLPVRPLPVASHGVHLRSLPAAYLALHNTVTCRSSRPVWDQASGSPISLGLPALGTSPRQPALSHLICIAVLTACWIPSFRLLPRTYEQCMFMISQEPEIRVVGI